MPPARLGNAALEKRFDACGLELNLEKTKIVHCKDDDRREDYPAQSFDFLGYTFRPRAVSYTHLTLPTICSV